MGQFGMEHASTGTTVSEYHTDFTECMAFLNTFNWMYQKKKKSLPLVENNKFKTYALLFQLEYSNMWRLVSLGVPVSGHCGTESEAGMFCACRFNPQ